MTKEFPMTNAQCIIPHASDRAVPDRSDRRANWSLGIGHSLGIASLVIGHLPPPLRTHWKCRGNQETAGWRGGRCQTQRQDLSSVYPVPQIVRSPHPRQRIVPGGKEAGFFLNAL